MKKYIEFLMLTVETGQEYPITLPADTTVEALAEHLMPLMKKSIVSDICVKECPQEADEEVANLADLDECTELIFNSTDPGEDMTEAKAQEIISRLKNEGYTVPEMLTPSLFVEIYKDLEPEDSNT